MTICHSRGVVTADNKMYAIQTGIERKKKLFDNLVLHYHNYDRQYNVLGKKDKYYSETLTLKGERDFTFNNKLYGFGGEYKYDWANFETQTFTSQSKGHVSNLGTLPTSDTSLIKIKYYQSMEEMIFTKLQMKIKHIKLILLNF